MCRIKKTSSIFLVSRSTRLLRGILVSEISRMSRWTSISAWLHSSIKCSSRTRIIIRTQFSLKVRMRKWRNIKGGTNAWWSASRHKRNSILLSRRKTLYPPQYFRTKFTQRGQWIQENRCLLAQICATKQMKSQTIKCLSTFQQLPPTCIHSITHSSIKTLNCSKIRKIRSIGKLELAQMQEWMLKNANRFLHQPLIAWTTDSAWSSKKSQEVAQSVSCSMNR